MRVRRSGPENHPAIVKTPTRLSSQRSAASPSARSSEPRDRDRRDWLQVLAASGIGDFAKRRRAFLAQIGLRVRQTGADRRHRAGDLHLAKASNRLQPHLPELVAQCRYQLVRRVHPVDIVPNVSAATSRTIQSLSASARVMDSAAGFICENASALTAARRTCASPSVVTEVSAGMDSSSLRKPITPMAWTRTAASASRKASSAGLSVSLRRNSFSARKRPCGQRRGRGRPAAGSHRRRPGPSIRPCCRPRRSPRPAPDRPQS